jgi:hypothetical protein
MCQCNNFKRWISTHTRTWIREMKKSIVISIYTLWLPNQSHPLSRNHSDSHENAEQTKANCCYWNNGTCNKPHFSVVWLEYFSTDCDMFLPLTSGGKIHVHSLRSSFTYAILDDIKFGCLKLGFQSVDFLQYTLMPIKYQKQILTFLKVFTQECIGRC